MRQNYANPAIFARILLSKRQIIFQKDSLSLLIFKWILFANANNGRGFPCFTFYQNNNNSNYWSHCTSEKHRQQNLVTNIVLLVPIVHLQEIFLKNSASLFLTLPDKMTII